MSQIISDLVPRSVDELAIALAQAHRARQPVGTPDLRQLNRVLTHVPEDMTVIVHAGMTLGALQTSLAEHGQWIPVDPPHADTLTIGELLAFDRSGPRRFGYGSIRDHVIGMKIALADGRVIRSGGQVVKNVAGFDLMKLFIGDHGSLGVIVEATFKLLPKPRTCATCECVCSELADVETRLRGLLNSPVTPVAIDLYYLAEDRRLVLRVCLEGMPEDVEWQIAAIHPLGFQPATSEDFESRFWARFSLRAVSPVSVLPSRLTESLSGFLDQDLIARAGNGIIYAPGRETSTPARSATALARRVKESFDPHHILPDLPT